MGMWSPTPCASGGIQYVYGVDSDTHHHHPFSEETGKCNIVYNPHKHCFPGMSWGKHSLAVPRAAWHRWLQPPITTELGIEVSSDPCPSAGGSPMVVRDA